MTWDMISSRRGGGQDKGEGPTFVGLLELGLRWKVRHDGRLKSKLPMVNG